ncbi:MAG: methyl-accepting chemotaxis protein [Planctomycetota bacterium]
MLNKIRSLGLATRIIAIMLIVLVAVLAVNYTVIVKMYTDAAQAGMVDKASAFTATADAAKTFAGEKLVEAGALDKQGLLADLKEVQARGGSYTEAKIFGTLPVIVGWHSAKLAADKENLDFSVAAFEARNPDNAPKTEFETALLTDLTAQAEAGTGDVIHRIEESTNTLHYMRAIRLEANCLSCHGHPSDSPTGDGKDILGFPMEDWPVGYVHGAYHVKLPLEPVDQQVASFLGTGMMWSVPLVLGAVGLFVVLLRMMFGKPIKALIHRVRDIAEGEGDLTARLDVKSQDELGQLAGFFNLFIAKVHDVIAEVVGTTEDVAAASTQIASSSEEIAAGMNEQSQQITQVSAAVEQMSASVIEVARKSADASGASEQAGKAADEGGEVIRETITDMGAISDAVASSSTQVESLGKRGEEIGAIVSVINDIADQTNLLALNAAIEAARAGEHGRGFAVVADEVRKLADRTTKATEEIGQSINAIRDETAGAVEQMGQSAERVGAGVERAEQSGDSLRKIVASAKEVSAMIQSIAAAAEEQSSAAEQVSSNIESISQVTRQAAEGTNQAAEAATSLSATSERLLQLVGSFKVERAGHGH